MTELRTLAVVIFILHAVTPKTDINNPRSCPYNEVFEPDKSTCCENLNMKRTAFSKCCKYPILVVYREDYEACIKTCSAAAKNTTLERCCVMPCCFKRLGILTDDILKISTEGLINSFMMSVNYNETWREPIADAVESCTTAVDKTPNPRDYQSFWDCYEKVPFYLYDIVDCTYDYNYLQCPNYPFDKDACYESYYYVFDCFLNGTGLLASPLLDPRMRNEVQIEDDGGLTVVSNWTYLDVNRSKSFKNNNEKGDLG